MYLAGRWIYFAAMLNWDHPGDADPETAAWTGRHSNNCSQTSKPVKSIA